MATPIDSFRLLNQGTAALARATRSGFKVDCEYFKSLPSQIESQTSLLRKDILENTEIGRAWFERYGDMVNLSSGLQFKNVLEFDIGFKGFKISEKGNKSADADVISKLPAEFASRYLNYKQLEQAYGTFVKPIIKETDDNGFVHANFPLGRVKTYRGSCSSPNLQQQPKRNKMLKKLIRRGFIPRASNRVLFEMDLKGAECAIGACIHKDPAMIAYVTDDTLDMHRDGAMRVFKLEKEQVSKDIRNSCKGDFTFAEFYGASFNTVAPNLWDYTLDPEFKTADGIVISQHLARHGIKDFAGFSSHIRQVEKDFWGKMFPGYAQWKEDIWQEYINAGYIQVITGFYLTQESTKEQILNAPIQGPSFHYLLNILIRMTAKMIKAKMSSLIIAQIHDAILFDAIPKEIPILCNMYWDCQEEVRKEWDWITIPIRAEMEVSDEGGSWAKMNELGFVERSVA